MASAAADLNGKPLTDSSSVAAFTIADEVTLGDFFAVGDDEAPTITEIENSQDIVTR